MPAFFIFLQLCSCGKAHILPKERDSLCLWIAICVFNIICRRITGIEIEVFFVQILPHVWVDLAGENLDIIRINSKNPEHKRFYSLRVILSYYLSHFITLFIGIMDFMLWGGFRQVLWGGYGHCPNPHHVSNFSLKSVQILPEFSVQMHPTP